MALCAILGGVGVQAVAADQVNAYQGQRGTALIIDFNGDRIFMAAGGAVPNGAATSGDCFIKAHMTLKKSPNYYEGALLPLHNELFDLDASDVHGKGVGLYLSENEIRVGGAQVDGICADGTDFSGNYAELQKSNDDYRKVYLYFMSLAYQDSSYLYKNKDLSGAAKDLQPFVENFALVWLQDKDNRKVLIPALNDYAYILQIMGNNVAALHLLQEVTQYEPKRVVAWLNIADSYWAQSDDANARKCYQKYVDLMTEENMKGKIPKRVLNRINSH